MEGGCSKIVLIIVNAIFLIFGLACLIAGIVFRVGFDTFKDALVEHSGEFNLKYAGETFGVIVIVFGCFIILIAGLGCLGACCHSRVLLGIYGVVVAIILLAEIVAVAVAVAKGSEAENAMQDGLKKALFPYNDKVSTKTAKDKAFDAIFSSFQCCGVHNYTDFDNNDVVWDPRNTKELIPVACCKKTNYEKIDNSTYNNADVKRCLQTADETDSYTNGCYQGLLDFIAHYKYVAIGVGVTIFLIEIFVAVMAFIMCRALGDA